MARTNRATDDNSELTNRLNRIGYDYSLLTPKQQSYLLSINDAIASIFRREQTALDMMAGNSINVKRIAEMIGVTRDTIYHHQVLRDYIDCCAKDFKALDMSARHTDMADEIARLRAEVYALQSRDVDYEETLLQLDKAMTEIERLRQQLALAQSGYGFGIVQASPENKNIVQFHRNDSLTIVSWNVNGLRARIDNGFFAFIQAADPDIICLQETRLDKTLAETLSVNGYQLYWHHAKKQGYSGTAIFTKAQPVRVIKGMGIDRFDDEGRVIAAEFSDYTLVNCYAPASQESPNRMQYRMDFDDAFREYLQVLEATKPLIVCGDFNVAHQEIDIESPFPGTLSGVSPEERQKLDDLLATGYDDALRLLYPDLTHVYSWWPYTDHKRNHGLRIDYFLTSERLRDRIIDITYRSDIMGSDHCPVMLTITMKS